MLNAQVCELFEDCVADLDSQRPDFDDAMERGRGMAEHGFVLTGSRGIWCGSDVDLRMEGDAADFLTHIADFIDANSAYSVVWKCQNLLTFTANGVEFDVLFTGRMEHVHPVWPFTQTQYDMIKEFNTNQTPPRMPVVPYDAEKTAMLTRMYGLVEKHPAYRAMVNALKIQDPQIPTCCATLMVALAAYTIKGADEARRWTVAFEIIAQFVWRFVNGHTDEGHIGYSFIEEIWKPFYNEHLFSPSINPNDPIGSFFGGTPQHARVVFSPLVVMLTCDFSYPLRETPVFLAGPRPLPDPIVTSMCDYIVAANGTDEFYLRQLPKYVNGFHQRAMQLVQHDALGMFIARQAPLSEAVVELL